MSTSSKTEFKRWQPLPALTPAFTPEARENRPQSLGETERGDSKSARRKIENVHSLFPLPGGESQSEGERHTNFSTS